jgi:uncharacterized membrane protein YqhA
MNWIENIFEGGLWNSRFIIILAVIFGLLGAILLFVIGGIIGAIDFYLIGVVMIIFSFGLYELFISEIDPANDEEGNKNKILAIHSLDQLKDKISKVIVMVLVVGFFQKVGHTIFTGALELFYLALSITAVSVGLYFLSKVGHHDH